MIGAVAAIALVVVLVTTVFGGGTSRKPAANVVAPTTNTGPAAGGGASPTPATVTVAVLNGTSTPGLARTVAANLRTSGYRIGTVTNAPDQQHATTTVAYATGSRSAARAVAQAIGADPASISAEDASTRVVAGPSARVVVTVGADRHQ